MSPDEFDLFLTYLYSFGNKRVKYKLSFFLDFPDAQNMKYSLVQYFSHIRQTQSPNWSIIPADARRDDWLGLGLKEDMDVRKMVDGLLHVES
jgi:hypothetical protein